MMRRCRAAALDPSAFTLPILAAVNDGVPPPKGNAIVVTNGQ